MKGKPWNCASGPSTSPRSLHSGRTLRIRLLAGSILVSFSALHYELLLRQRATEFELGLELDSAEVRGILIFNGQEWGRFVFHIDGARFYYSLRLQGYFRFLELAGQLPWFFTISIFLLKRCVHSLLSVKIFFRGLNINKNI